MSAMDKIQAKEVVDAGCTCINAYNTVVSGAFLAPLSNLVKDLVNFGWAGM